MNNVNLNPSVLIDFFDGTDYHFLSNFYVKSVDYVGLRWPTTEHAFQALKTYDRAYQEKIRTAKTPGEAKRLGQKRAFEKAGVEMRPDWDTVKFNVMIELLRVKFKNPGLRRRLLATGNARLVEGNTWNDTCWGVCDGVGANNLGRSLELVRAECLVEELSKKAGFEKPAWGFTGEGDRFTWKEGDLEFIK